jgi:EAL domain-containing protein (putative c-di-GMP-specific phosphodiesterase class I)
MVIRIYKFDEIRSFFGKEKALELLKIVANGIKEVGKGMLKGRSDNKDFAVSFRTNRVDEKKFMHELESYVKDNFQIYQVKLYFGIYNIDDVYESIDALLIQTKFAVKEIEGNAIKNYIYCDAKMKKRMIENDNITSEMKKALAKNEFEIFLQPVFDLKSRKIISAEALTRWHHPKRGYIPPGEYVPIFEENGFIVNIDMFVWEGVCKIIRSWLDRGVEAVPISVNVSRIDLFSIDFYKIITVLVEKYNIPVEYLRLEITESAFVLNEINVIEIVDKLRTYGFKILMDDFGSGYSSLNSLKFINIDILKIDMDLVKGIEESIRQADILKSVINLGNTLNLEMICEGVETENQAKFVEENGCKKAQGWLFSKAIPVDI